MAQSRFSDPPPSNRLWWLSVALHLGPSGALLILTAALNCAQMSSLLFALSEATQADSSHVGPIPVALAIISVISFVAFVAVELFVASEPVLPLTLLARRTPFCVGLISGVIAIVNFSMIYFLPFVVLCLAPRRLTKGAACSSRSC